MVNMGHAGGGIGLWAEEDSVAGRGSRVGEGLPNRRGTPGLTWESGLERPLPGIGQWV